MKKRNIGLLLEAPAILLLIVAFIASIYAKIKMPDLVQSWGTPVVLAIIVGLYFWGRSLEKAKEF